MKTYYDLPKIANQSFSLSLNGREAIVRLHLFRGVMYADVKVDAVRMTGSTPCTSGVSFITSDATRELGGSLYFETCNGRLPSWDDFDGATCRLVHDTEGA